MRILVTGGAGFIGSNFVNYLSGKNHELLILDSLTYAADVKNLTKLDTMHYKLVIGDINDESFIECLIRFEKIDNVVIIGKIIRNVICIIRL